MRTFLATCLFACVLAPSAARADAPPAPADPRPLIAEAAADGRPRVVIPPGTYRLAPAAGSAVVLPIGPAKNLEIVADGVTLVCTVRTRAVEFRRCTGVSLRGLTVDYDPLPFTQGKVVAVAEDKGSLDVRLDAGYPREAWSRIDLIDPATRFRKKGMPFLWGTRAELVAPDVVRVSLKEIGAAASVGDLASLSAGPERGGIPHAITLEDSADTTLRNVTIHAAPGMGLVDAGGDGGTRLVGCKVVPGPRPAGATEDRLLATSWDALQHQTARRGPVVEDCTIESAGDDSWSVTGGDWMILRADGDRLVLAPRGDDPGARLRPGDRLRAALDSPEAIVREAADVPRDKAGVDAAILDKIRTAEQWSVWRVSRRTVQVVLDRPSPWAAGRSVFCPDLQNRGFVFRNNRVHSPGRGALIKAFDGLIEGNTFDTAHAAVTVCPELPNEAAAGLRNLVIRNNTIVETGYFCPAPWSSQAGAISISATEGGQALRPAGAFGHIAIEGNTFRGVCGPNIVVTSARDVLIRGNRFADVMRTTPPTTGAAYGIDPACVLWIDRSDGVRLEGNVVEKMGPFGKRTLFLGPGTKNVTGADGGGVILSPP